MVIGVTGSSGSGKSILAKAFFKAGFWVIDADKTVHALYQSDHTCIGEIAAAFGSQILTADGQIDRKILGKMVFTDPEKKAKLERVVFPHVLRILKREITEAGRSDVVLDAPTLFESGADCFCDVTVAVLAKKEARMDRIQRRDGISQIEAMRRISAQPTDDFYVARVDKVLYNDNRLEDFLRVAEDFVQMIQREGKAG